MFLNIELDIWTDQIKKCPNGEKNLSAPKYEQNKIEKAIHQNIKYL